MKDKEPVNVSHVRLLRVKQLITVNFPSPNTRDEATVSLTGKWMKPLLPLYMLKVKCLSEMKEGKSGMRTTGGEDRMRERPLRQLAQTTK